MAKTVGIKVRCGRPEFLFGDPYHGETSVIRAPQKLRSLVADEYMADLIGEIDRDVDRRSRHGSYVPTGNGIPQRDPLPDGNEQELKIYGLKDIPAEWKEHLVRMSK